MAQQSGGAEPACGSWTFLNMPLDDPTKKASEMFLKS
jgi:hypothetical protein